MTTDVLIVVDSSARELVSALLIQHYLRQYELEVKICSRLVWRICCNKYRPKAVVLPNAGAPNCSSVANSCFAFVLPSESCNGQKRQILATHVGTHSGTSSYRCDTEFADIFFSWGEQMSEWLIESGAYRPEQIVTTGHPATDHWMLPKTGGRTETIGLTTTFRVLNNVTSGPRNFFKKINHLEMYGGDGTFYAPPEHAETWVFWEASFMRLMVNIFHEAIVPHNIKCQIRPHPFENQRPYDFFRKLTNGGTAVEKKGTISEWLENIDVLFTYMSGSGIDAFVQGTPVVSLKNILNRDALERIPKGFMYEYFDWFWQIDSISQLNEYARAAFKGELAPAADMERIAEFVRMHFSYPRKEPAAQRVAAAIKDYLENNKARQFKPVSMPYHTPLQKGLLKGLTLYPELAIDVMRLKYLLKLDDYDPMFTYISWKFRENAKANSTFKALISSWQDEPPKSQSLRR